MGLQDLFLNNGVTLRDEYPTAMGSTTSMIATQPAPGAVSAEAASADAVSAAALPGGVHPVMGGVIFLFLVFGLMFLAKRLGTDDDFKSIKPSVYNIFTISLAAAAGLPLLKYGAVKLRIPGVSAWIMAA